MLLEAKNIKHFVRDRLLFEIDSLQIHKNDRIGLVGKNGSGKTTLLEILSGKNTPDKGTVHNHAIVELLPQLKEFHSTKSGGEITQQYINQAIHRHPEILFADEPTTNLDTSHIEWIENILKHWQGAFVIVSHDRSFLDCLCTSIWEISDGKLTVYNGHYTDYTEQKLLEQQQHEANYEKYINKKKQLEEALLLKTKKAERATKTPKKVSNSEARLMGSKPYFAKKQKKLQHSAKALETRIEKLEKVEKPKEIAPIKMNLPNEQTFKGRIIIRVNDVSGTIGERILWKPASFHIRGGDKLAIIGPNGCGKTTLVKKILEPRKDHKSESGVSHSPAMKIGYFSQHLELLDTDTTILENVRSTSKQGETLIRTVLARMHFFRDDVYKEVAVLSGGERVKVALAKLFVSDVNTLILDEPTNFLDLEAITALENLLTEYEGTIIFISHDRRFIKKIATRILSFQENSLHLFEGSYTKFREAEKEKTASQKNPDKEVQETLLLLETKISDVLSRLSLEPTEDLELEFQALLEEKRILLNR